MPADPTLTDLIVREAKDMLSRQAYGAFTNHVSLGLLIAADIAQRDTCTSTSVLLDDNTINSCVLHQGHPGSCRRRSAHTEVS